MFWMLFCNILDLPQVLLRICGLAFLSLYETLVSPKKMDVINTNICGKSRVDLGILGMAAFPHGFCCFFSGEEAK